MPLPQGQLLASEEVQQNVSTRFEQAMGELKIKGERQRAEKARKEQEEERKQLKEQLDAPMKERLAFQRDAESAYNLDSRDQQLQDEEERDAILEEDSELDQLRQARLAQLKKKKEEHETNLAKGHGEYEEVAEENFLKEVLKSKFVVAHFFHNEFERCKIMDKHIRLLSRKHVETRFFRINAEKTPFFVEKLSIKTLPTLVFFQDGKAIDRQLGFQGFTNGDEFPTRELEERMGLAGVIKMERAFYEDETEPHRPPQRAPMQSILARTEDFDDPFDD